MALGLARLQVGELQVQHGVIGASSSDSFSRTTVNVGVNVASGLIV